MKKVYVIEKVRLYHVSENDQFRYIDKTLCAYAPEAFSPVPIGEFRYAKFIEVNNGKEKVTFSFVPDCEHADFITDSFEKLIRDTEELRFKTDQLNFRIKENTELQISFKKLTDYVEELKTKNRDTIDKHNETSFFIFSLKKHFWKRLKFLFFPKNNS